MNLSGPHSRNPYTQALLFANPIPDPVLEESRHRTILEGMYLARPIHLRDVAFTRDANMQLRSVTKSILNTGIWDLHPQSIGFPAIMPKILCDKSKIDVTV